MAIEESDRRESAEPDSDAGSEERAIDRDELFHLLQNERRRRALDYLRRQEGPIRMRDVVDHVAAEEHDTSPEALRSDERKRVHIALYQSHLPKLDQVGVIDYNQDRGVVTRTSLADQLDPYLEAAAGEVTGERTTTEAGGHLESESDADPATASPAVEVGWYHYYLALSGFGLLLTLGAIAIGSSVVTLATTAAVVALAFAALATLQWAHVHGVSLRWLWEE